MYLARIKVEGLPLTIAAHKCASEVERMLLQYVEVFHILEVRVDDCPIVFCRRNQHGGFSFVDKIMMICGVKANWLG
jgi:hypothetical protein